MSSKPNFKAYEQVVAVGEHRFILRKGPSGYGKHYVLDAETRRYLSKGAASYSGAQSDMFRIVAERTREAAE